MIKILHVVNALNQGGTEQVLLNWAKNKTEKDIHFDFVVHSHDIGILEEELKQLNCNVYHIERPRITSLWKYWHDFKKVLNECSPDIVHGHMSSIASLYLLIAKTSNIITVAHSHNIYPQKMGIHDYVHKILTFTTRFVADFFMAPTMEAGCDRFGRRIVNGPRFTVISDGIDASSFSYSNELRYDMRQKHGVGNGSTVFITVGRLEPQKNQQFAIETFSRFHNLNKDSYLFIVGAGSLLGNLTRKVDSLGLAKSVRFVGIQSNVGPWLSMADIFIFPSIMEGLGMSLIEAEANGLPVLVSTGVPLESILPGSVSKRLTADSADKWEAAANELLERGNCREDGYYVVRNAGFDIQESVASLTNKYRMFVK